MTPQEAAEWLHLTREQVYHLLRTEKIHGFKRNRGWLIDPAELRRYRRAALAERSTLRTPLIQALISN